MQMDRHHFEGDVDSEGQRDPCVHCSCRGRRLDGGLQLDRGLTRLGQAVPIGVPKTVRGAVRTRWERTLKMLRVLDKQATGPSTEEGRGASG